MLVGALVNREYGGHSTRLVKHRCLQPVPEPTDNIRVWKLSFFPACLSGEAVRYVQMPCVSISTLTRIRRRTKTPFPQPVAARARAKIPSSTHRFWSFRFVQLGLLRYQRQRTQAWAADSEITLPYMAIPLQAYKVQAPAGRGTDYACVVPGTREVSWQHPENPSRFQHSCGVQTGNTRFTIATYSVLFSYGV